MKLDKTFYIKVLENLYDGVYVLDRKRKIFYWNEGAERLSGYSADEMLSTNCFKGTLMHTDHEGNNLCKNLCPVAHTLKDGKIQEANVFLHHKDGHRVSVAIRVTPIFDENKNITGAVEIFSDNTASLHLQQQNQQLQKLALQDVLTEVCNRRHAEFQLKSISNEMNRYENTFGILMIDIDFFKKVNDTYGHHVGDKVLKMVAKSMRAGIRSFDNVCRWGGEEFLAIIRNVNLEELTMIAEKMRFLVENSHFVEDGQEVRVTISVGGAMATQNVSMEELIEKADARMYESKENGRNRVTIQ